MAPWPTVGLGVEAGTWQACPRLSGGRATEKMLLLSGVQSRCFCQQAQPEPAEGVTREMWPVGSRGGRGPGPGMGQTFRHMTESPSFRGHGF